MKVNETKEKILTKLYKQRQKINREIYILETVKLNKNDSLETKIFKLYLLCHSVILITEEINELGYRIKTNSHIGERKYTTNDISEILKNKKVEVNEELKKLVKAVNLKNTKASRRCI